MKLHLIFTALICLLLVSCGSSKNADQGSREESVEKQLDDANRGTLPLYQQISKEVNGVILRGGVPVFQRVANDRSKRGRNIEPLYVVNGVPMGNSYRGIIGVVNSTQVKEIRGLIGPETATYGGQGSNGVIEITTY